MACWKNWEALEEANLKVLIEKNGAEWQAVHGIVKGQWGTWTCSKCWGAQLQDLGRVLEHIGTRKHANKVEDMKCRHDPLKDVPLAHRPYMIVKNGYAKCILCCKFWDQDHATSEKHMMRVRNPLAYGWQAPAPGPVAGQSEPAQLRPPAGEVSSPPPQSTAGQTAAMPSVSRTPSFPYSQVSCMPMDTTAASKAASTTSDETSSTQPRPPTPPPPARPPPPLPAEGQLLPMPLSARPPFTCSVASTCPEALASGAEEIPLGWYIVKQAFDGAQEPQLGYLKLQVGDAVLVTNGVQTQGEEGNVYLYYIYGNVVVNGLSHKGWFATDALQAPDEFWA
eukprot:TRINITY_DN23995_c0_g1_i1.p1 TRINITY_DN23995_c0_g1~~TRINITY_DN23995_c0_g1_i1.p1  ORF type:complete len:337 (-),score=41.28 TRINITY_DN23995_c0_g1_i1:234-1244(-)